MIDIAAMIILGRLFLDPDAVNGGVTSDSREVMNPWDVLTQSGARDVTYVVDVDPETVAAYQERQRTLKALREI